MQHFQTIWIKNHNSGKLKTVEFIDFHLNLTNGIYQPYNKPNNIPTCVHVKSNHPPSIIRKTSEPINSRLSSISSNSTTFNNNTAIYQQALIKSGYNYKLNTHRRHKKTS
ncbi:OSTF1 [Bugula neritina]|uniref:OSTF1 n=1 Tax=Bugula neritina TaxID=10212 RepID=A0A7J7K6A2_BUGNE|nr:OSTF1 [Bugula neritina]